jgi:hypothetical protein
MLDRNIYQFTAHKPQDEYKLSFLMFSCAYKTKWWLDIIFLCFLFLTEHMDNPKHMMKAYLSSHGGDLHFLGINLTFSSRLLCVDFYLNYMSFYWLYRFVVSMRHF